LRCAFSVKNLSSTNREKLSYLVVVLANLKIGKGYDGFLYLVESTRNPPPGSKAITMSNSN
jgi:hypothetical protein